MTREAVYTLRVDTRQAQADFRRFMTQVQRDTQVATRSMPGGRSTAASDPAASLASMRALTAAAASFAGAITAAGVARTVVELTDLGTEARRAGAAFEFISGGAAQAAANLEAIKRASQGTLTTLDAQRIATSALNLGLAQNATELERVTTISRGIVAVSPVINDMQSAFSELSLTLANMSWRRLDQLGLSVEEVRAKYDALRESNASLSDQAAFSQAVLDTAEQKFGALAKSADFAATGLERIRNKWAEARAEVGKDVESWDLFDYVANAWDRRDQANARAVAEDNLRLVEQRKSRATRQMQLAEGVAGEQRGRVDLQTYAATLAEIELLRRNMAQLDEEWKAAMIEAAKFNPEIAEQVEAFGLLTDAIDPATQSLEELNAAAAESGGGEALKKVMEDAAAMADAIGRAVESAGRAAESRVYAIRGNADEAVAAYEAITLSLWDFVRAQQAAGKSDETILNLLDAEAKRVGEISGLYDAAVEGANRLATANTMLTRSLGVASTAMVIYSQNLETMGTTALNVAGAIHSAAATGGPGRMSARIPFTGGLSSDQVDAATRAGMPTEYKGMTLAAKQTLDAWTDAGAATASAWKASLESALRGIPGLFDTSDVTQDDLNAAAAGTYEPKADEYLRRLRDEVRNGKDYEGVDIMDAARRAGIDPSLPPEEILRQFEGAWDDSSLFANGQNLDLINQDAVRAALDRADRSASGEEALRRMFGLEPAGGVGTGGRTFTGAGGGVGDDAMGGVSDSMAKAIESGFQSYDFSAATKSMADSLLSAVNQEANAAAFEAVGGRAAGLVFDGFSEGIGDYDWAAAILAAIAEQMSGEYDD